MNLVQQVDKNILVWINLDSDNNKLFGLTRIQKT
jgi:hypothetical protein